MSTVRETDFLPLSQDYELSATWAPEISIDQYETETQRLSCRFCRAETAQDDRFCQDCGAPQLRDSDGETDSAQREAWRGLAAITAAWSRFTAHAKKVAPAWLFRSARPARGAYLAVVLSAVLFALPPVLHYLYVEKIAAEARQALAENRLNDAVRTCDQLYVARGGSLSAAQREIANEALLRRSQVFAGNGNYRAALSDLAKITPEFSQYAVAITLTRSFAQLFAEQGRQDRRAPGSGGSDERTPVVETTSSSGQTTEQPADLASQADEEQASGAQEAAAGRGSSQEELPSPDSASQSSQPAKALNGSKQGEDTAESDVVVYNRLLAGYFTNPHGPKKKGAGEGDTASREPPSFKEWVEMGKPNF